jgi:hypothetical protein
MNKYKINITYGEEDINKLLIDIIVKEIRKNYEI